MSKRTRAAAVSALVLSGLAGLGAVGVVARQRSLAGDLARVQPGLRAPLLVLGRGQDGEPGTVCPGNLFQRASKAQELFTPAGLGTRRMLSTPQGPVSAWLYETAHRAEQAGSGALVWIHGGGLVGGSPAQDHALCSRLATDLGCLVVCVDYRLAPQHPYPAAIDDCFGALAWLHENASDLGVDPERLAVGGASAGGGLAACVAQRARDAGVPLVFQLLIYPMLDDRTGAGGQEVPGRGEFVWTARSNAQGWQAYLGHPEGEEETRPWAAAARCHDLAGLPAAWIGVGDLDLFLDEDLDYARRLEQSDVPVTVHVEPGMYHGADFCTWSPQMRAFRTQAVEALGSAFRPRP